MLRLGVFAFVLWTLTATAAHSASILVDGAPGAPGANGGPVIPGEIFAPSGEDGGHAPVAEALSLSADASNQATAHGGIGGRGGNGTAQNLGSGAGGDGGFGGIASAEATVDGVSGAASAASEAVGGAGGAGGNGGLGQAALGAGGVGGSGGSSSATSYGFSVDASATATSTARGGAGGAGGAAIRTGVPPVYEPAPGGGGGSAEATAAAEASDDSDATAGAFGGASGVGSTSAGSAATAYASAGSESGNATALAEATGGAAARGPGLTSLGGAAEALATANAVLGDATAISRIFSGAAAPIAQGPGVSDLPTPGGAGADASAVDSVWGSAGGRLTLLQEVTASSSNTLDGTRGGNASSELHGTNPAGGELHVEVTATGGGGGGDALGIAVATGANDSRVEATANALGGTTSRVIYCGIYSCGISYGPSGDSTALATAIGLGEVVATANAGGLNAPAHAVSEAQTAGPVSRVQGTLDATGPTFVGGIYGPDPIAWPMRSITASASLDTTAAGADSPATRSAETHVTAAPRAADVASWTSGNANAIEALEDGQVLALGAIGAGGSLEEAAQYSGSVEVDLTASDFDPADNLALAFLDPASFGAGIDFLDLQLTREGVILFERSFSDEAAALAALDDAVFYLGDLLATADEVTTLVLAFSVSLPSGTANTGFSLDFALLSTPVPEPAVGLLAFAAVLVCLTRSQRGSSS